MSATAAPAFLPARAVDPAHPDVPPDLEALAQHEPGEPTRP